jgi:HK97 family phage prohead protease
MHETVERRVLFRSVTLEHRVGTDYPYVAGLGAVFYRAEDPGTEFDIFGDGSVMERIMPGAFSRTLREMDQIGCFNHDPNLLLGRKSAGTMRLGVTELGLAYEITPPDTQAGRDVCTSIKRGDVCGSSFTFMPRKGGTRMIPQMNGNCVRELHDVDVFDVGPVSNPAYASTTAGMRALGDQIELRSRLNREMAEVSPVPAVIAYVAARARQIDAAMRAACVISA